MLEEPDAALHAKIPGREHRNPGLVRHAGYALVQAGIGEELAVIRALGDDLVFTAPDMRRRNWIVGVVVVFFLPEHVGEPRVILPANAENDSLGRLLAAQELVNRIALG